MTSQQILQSDFLDILFDNRNKEYGAYALRKTYNKQIAKALSLSVAFIFLLMFFIRPSAEKIEAAFTVGDEVIIRNEAVPDVEKPKPEEPKPTAQKVPAKQTEFVTPTIVDKPEVKTLATQTQLINSNVGSITTDGLDVLPHIDPPPTPSGSGQGTTPAPEEPKKEVMAPDKQPQFPGGLKAWADFLNKNLHSPQDLESGEKRTVNVRFYVDVDGTVTNFKVVQSGGAEFDNEVIRVLKRMPKWMPALQKGQPVAVSFTQPVTFVAMEE